MKRPSDLKADIEKIKKLKALQQKATDKLDKITVKAASPNSKKKKTAKAVYKKASDRGSAPKKPAAKAVHKKSSDRGSAPKKKTKPTVKKRSFWQKLFGGDAGMRS